MVSVQLDNSPLVDLGWHRKSDRDGEYFVLNWNSFTVHAESAIRSRGTSVIVYLEVACSQNEFAKIVDRIMGTREMFSSLKWEQLSKEGNRKKPRKR